MSAPEDGLRRVAEIRRRLEAALAPTELEVLDESAAHRGHAGARTGKGHFKVVIAAPAFAGKPALACHRLVYAALGELFDTDVHALTVEIRGG